MFIGGTPVYYSCGFFYTTVVPQLFSFQCLFISVGNTVHVVKVFIELNLTYLCSYGLIFMASTISNFWEYYTTVCHIMSINYDVY